MSTLFSYFTKVPKKASNKSPICGSTAEDKKSTIPKEQANGFTPIKAENARKSSLDRRGTQPHVQTEAEPAGISLFDIVWAQLEGHPWWPSIICNHPTRRIYLKKNECHVQFFGDPPSRAWVKTKKVKPFVESENEKILDPAIKEAARQASEALALPREDRDMLINCMPSDEEEDEGDDIGMEIDEAQQNIAAKPRGLKRECRPEGISDKGSDDEDDDDDDEVTGRKNNSKRPRRKASKRSVKQPKRKRLMIESGSESEPSEDEYKPSGTESEESCSSGVDEDADEPSPSENDEEEEELKASRKRKRSVTTPKHVKSKGKQAMTPLTPLSNKTPFSPLPSSLSAKVSGSASKAAASLVRFQMTASPAPKPNSAEQSGGFLHDRLDWLKEENRKDKHGRPVSHPDYDPTTLLVPSSFHHSKEMTPGMKQWWTLKSKNFDVVLFFKVGKFYELYHMDAVIGVNELGLVFMKGNFAHCGFPEHAFARYSDTLIQKGFKIGRVEQTETPQMMEERCKKNRTNSKYDKVVKREMCAIITKGTKTYNFMDGDCTESEAAFLLAIAEKGADDTSGGESSYGVCFVDTSIGKFYIGQFNDDRQASRLRTLVAHYTPVQDFQNTHQWEKCYGIIYILYSDSEPKVICPRGGITSKTQSLMNHELTSAIKEYLSPGTEFWDAAKTLKFLAESSYFEGKENRGESSVKNWPKVLKDMTDGDQLGLNPGDGYGLALSALGAVVFYLKKCFIEEELLSMGNFEEYVPLDCAPEDGKRASRFTQGREHMILDNVALTNLDIVSSGGDSSVEGTLLERLDHCCTSFGKRLFKQWLCAPLCNPAAINDRLNAVEDLMNVPAVVADVKEILKGLPDLERQLRKIHSLGSLSRSQNHPDSRAIFYSEATFSKRKITELLSTLEGFGKAVRVVHLFEEHVDSFSSKLLKQIITPNKQSGSGKFPQMQDILNEFQQAFDHNKARNDGVILPKPGHDHDYDAALDEIKECIAWFDGYLNKQRKRLGAGKHTPSVVSFLPEADVGLFELLNVRQEINYWGTAKNRYQLEVPESVLKRAGTPDEYKIQSSKKGYKRYWTSEIEKKMAELKDAEEKRDALLQDTMRRVFHSFDKEYETWDKAVQCLAVLDALLSLSAFSSQGDGLMCRPEVVVPGGDSSQDVQPFLEIREGRHPCICRTFSGGDFIPNDTIVGIADEQDGEGRDAVNGNSTCVLVTGPNMGGKSTLMRQAGLIVVIAQLGCYVPAELCRLTPVDRVFTRLGAHDRILSGESTFFVELSETSTILRHATKHSLVLLDELGRGTATYDGTAIACAVVKEISQQIRCRTLFSTHYHSLVEEFAADPNVRLGHMACMVETEDESGDPSKETITFLYKFVKGACPKSYGFNAARLAGIPDEIISVAVQKAKQFEETVDHLKLFRSIVSLACGDKREQLVSMCKRTK